MRKTFYSLSVLFVMSLICPAAIAQTVADWTYLGTGGGTRVCFASPTHGFTFLGTTPEETLNGGRTWDSFLPVQSTAGVFDAAAPSPNHIIIIARYDIYVTFDGVNYVSNGSGGDFKDVFFLDDNRGWVSCDDGDMMVTVNGGLTWSRVFTSLNKNLITTAFISNTTGLVGTDDGKIYYTTNNCSSFTAATTPNLLTSDYSISAIKYLSSTVVVASATSQTNFTGLLLRSTDGGHTWSITHSDVAELITDMDFVNDTTGYAVGILRSPRYNNGVSLIYKTTDAGSTWTQLIYGGSGGNCGTYAITFRQGEGWMTGMSCTYKYDSAPVTPSGIGEQTGAALSAIYPNPVSGIMNVRSGLDMGDGISYTIADVSGRVIMSDAVTTPDFEIDVHAVSAGLYILTMNNGTNTSVIKFAKN